MKLSEKIYYCRKKDGKSQEALAEIIGVSRQSISKWENEEAEPEIAKLKLLAEAFGVTVDWLLSDEEPAEEKAESTYEYKEQSYSETNYNNTDYSSVSSNRNTDWVDALPGAIGKLIKRFGWLFGVYMAVVGSLFTFMGWLMRFISNSMFNSFNKTTSSMFDSFGGMSGMYYGDSFAGYVTDSVSDFTANNPVTIMGGAVMVLGIVLIIVGIVLAVVLKKKSEEKIYL